MGRMPARKTLRSWANQNPLKGCIHGQWTMVHHDHLVDEAKERLAQRALHKKLNGPFDQRWPVFLHQHRGLFFDPIWVCETCNQQDSFVKSSFAIMSSRICINMSLNISDLQLLSSIKISHTNKIPRKDVNQIVRGEFSKIILSRISYFQNQKNLVYLAVDQFK